MNKGFDAAGIVDQLASIYDELVANLRSALAAYINDRTQPDPVARSNGSFAYPELRISYSRRHASAAQSPAHSPGSISPGSTPPASLARTCFENI